MECRRPSHSWLMCSGWPRRGETCKSINRWCWRDIALITCQSDGRFWWRLRYFINFLDEHQHERNRLVNRVHTEVPIYQCNTSGNQQCPGKGSQCTYINPGIFSIVSYSYVKFIRQKMQLQMIIKCQTVICTSYPMKATIWNVSRQIKEVFHERFWMLLFIWVPYTFTERQWRFCWVNRRNRMIVWGRTWKKW